MKKLFYLAMVLSSSFTFNQSQTLYASQSMVTSPNVPASSKEGESSTSTSSYSTSTVIKKGGAQGAIQSSTSATSDAKKEEAQESAGQTGDSAEKDEMPEWMLESAQVAKDYVTSLDNGQYTQSWTKGDQLFQHTITQDEWTKALNSSRKGLGRVKSRTLKIQRPAWNPKGLPRGPYMVVEFETSFENAPESGELLTLRRGTDGKWRVLTYQVN